MNDTISEIRAIVSEADRMKNAYFFRPPTNAGGRRSYEKYHSHDMITWIDGKDTFAARYTVRCTCNNVYATGEYTRNGNKTTLTAIRNSLSRLEKRGE